MESSVLIFAFVDCPMRRLNRKQSMEFDASILDDRSGIVQGNSKDGRDSKGKLDNLVSTVCF